MLLHKHHIVDLYVLIDQTVKETPKTGRPALLSTSELVTILVWNTLTVRQKTLKDVHRWVCMYHQNEFPQIPHYSNFVESCHRALPQLIQVLSCLLNTTAPIRLADSTMLPVCQIKRADSHKVARNIADFGKNWQGWHFGFKLHASIDLEGRLCGLIFTPASVHDIHSMDKIFNEHTKVAVGDTHYGARVMGRKMFEKYGMAIIAPPHPSQKKKLATSWQLFLLSFRSKIESTFDVLKEHLHLVSSFPRSIKGYFLHYVRILLGYQVLSFAG